MCLVCVIICVIVIVSEIVELHEGDEGDNERVIARVVVRVIISVNRLPWPGLVNWAGSVDCVPSC